MSNIKTLSKNEVTQLSEKNGLVYLNNESKLMNIMFKNDTLLYLDSFPWSEVLIFFF